jgi:hypothetical protein
LIDINVQNLQRECAYKKYYLNSFEKGGEFCKRGKFIKGEKLFIKGEKFFLKKRKPLKGSQKGRIVLKEKLSIFEN